MDQNGKGVDEMKQIGMYGGSFNPLHLGHINDIVMAANQCDKLYVVVSVSNDPKEINHKERVTWIKNITQDMENVEVFEIFSSNTDKDDYDWQRGAEDIKRHIGKQIDIVFAGDDYKGKNIWEQLYKESKIVYFNREDIPISSTMIRKNPYQYFNYLPTCVQKFYTKKVCVIGTESCGKSTLVRNLAKVYKTSYVEEAGRTICNEAGGIDNMQKYHYFQILFEHKKLEKEALKTANKVLFIDTDALITLYYYQLGFPEHKKEDITFETLATTISSLNQYDLYLFLEPDVQWVQDGTRTYGDESIRIQNNQKLKELLHKNGIAYQTITGTYQKRYLKAKKIVNNLLEGS